MSSILKAVMLFLVLSMAQNGAHALEFSSKNLGGRQILLMQGTFETGDSRKFSQAIQKLGRVDELWFNSSGGAVSEGLEIGRKIRSLGLATKISAQAECYSICAFAFLGGVVREIEPGGVYGVHMFSAMCQKETIEELTRKITAVVKSQGDKGSVQVVALLLATEQRSATIARDQANYLLEMEVSLRLLFPNYETTCDNIRPLGRQELLSYNIVNSGG
jgi:hypothetical protein